MSLKPLRTMAFASLFLTVALAPPSASARPVTPSLLTACRNSFTPMDYDVFFGIAFVLALFFAFLGSSTWLASRRTARAQPAESNNRLCAVPIAFYRQLSVYCRSAFIAVATFLDLNNVDPAYIPRRGGTSYPVATVPGGQQGGGPRKVGVTRGSG